MQELLLILFAACFLPLFPFGMIFNALFQKQQASWVRSGMMLLWPLPGVWILTEISPEVPTWLIYWALASSLLYGFRSVVVKDFAVWVGFLSTSSWALSWIAVLYGKNSGDLLLHIYSFSFPLVILILLVGELESRYGSAYVSIVRGLAQTQPRLAVLVVITLLAAIGSPIFPAFVSMVNTVSHVLVILPGIAFGVSIVWLLWGWSGMELLQQLLVGAPTQIKERDLSQSVVIIYSLALACLVVGGLYLLRILL